MEESSTELFLLGLLSLADVILEIPMNLIVEGSPLSEPLKRALLHGDNCLARPMHLFKNYETGFWQNCLSEIPGITESELAELYLSAVHWAENAVSSHNIANA